MQFIEDLKGLSKDKIEHLVFNFLNNVKTGENILIIHPDYTRKDFTQLIVPGLIKLLKRKGARRVDFLNASGTHRNMEENEFLKKLGIESHDSSINFFNHKFDDPSHLINLGEISGGFVQDKTGGEIKIPIPVNVNKLIFNDYDLIVAISATVPHEATGFSGGLKIFFPGISGPEVIDLFHWAAAMISIENLIGTVNNAARDILNEGARYIFRNLKTRVVSFNMVNAELENAVLPLGLYFAAGYEGFIEAYEAACNLSIKAHIKYIDIPLNKVVQVMPENYDEIWTAGKGSYKLQRPGVMAENGEIILYGPHIKVFHSNDSINSDIINTGYHCRDYLKNYLERHPGFCKNSAAHLMNVAGPGKYDPSIDCEKLKFKITLATAITEELCKKVNLNYRNPDTLKKIDFQSSGKLWIEDGGKYLYELNTKKAEV